MITEHDLGALRVAATLTHTLPGLGLEVRADERRLLQVTAPRPSGVATSSAGERCPARSCTPCGFRAAVGRAHRRQRRGERLAFLDLPTGTAPEIDLRLPDGGASRPGGIHRVPSAGRWLWAFATTLDAATAHAVGAPAVAAAPPLADGDLVGLRWDDLTEVTLAYAETSARPGSAEEAAVIDLLEGLLAVLTAHQLVAAAHRADVDRRV